MAIGITWFGSEMMPQDDTSPVGGDIDLAAELEGHLGEVFEQGRSNFPGQSDWVRYRKVFAKNTGSTTIQNIVSYIVNPEYPSQVAFAYAKALDDDSADSETMPSGYLESDFVSFEGIEEGTGGGTLLPGDYLGFWVRLTIPPGLSAETGAYFGLGIAGEEV